MPLCAFYCPTPYLLINCTSQTRLIRDFPVTAFSTLTQLPASQLDNLREMGFDAMTPIRAASLPAILDGRDVRAGRKPAAVKPQRLD